MTTDNQAPDPTPAPLSTARLAEIRRAIAGHVGSLEKRRMIEDLLAHLDALTPRAPVDGEALGRLLRDMMLRHGMWSRVKSWGDMPEETRALWSADALALHAIGHAAGRSEGEAAESETTRHLIDQRNLAQRTAEDAHREIARLTAELAEARADRSHGPIADAALLTAKLYHDADDQSVQLAQIRVELDACRQKGAAARLDGAREEREAITGELSIEFERLSRIEHDRGELCPVGDADGNAHDAARDAYSEAAKIVRARGATEGRQG